MIYSRPSRGEDVLQHMDTGHHLCKGVYYGSLVAEPLTKEQLLSAFAVIQSSEANMDAFLQIYGHDFPGGPEAAATKCAEELYSDKLLEKLNSDMVPVYAADMNTGDGMMSEPVMHFEGYMGHGIELLPKIWPKPAVRVGSVFDGGGGFDGYTNYCGLCTYIDIDGGVFTSRCFQILVGETLVMEAHELVTDCDEYLLDGLTEFFPDEFRDFWDC